MSEVKINFKVVVAGAIAAVRKFTSTTEKGLTRIGKSQETIRENFRQIRNLAAIGAAAITAAFVVSTKAAAEFETGLLGVSKTVNDLTETELKELGEELRQISRTTPFATKELLELAKTAGQLGVTGKDNIILFTETIAKLGTAANISGEEAATALARILNITGESTENIDNLSSAIVQLGNNFAATESEIVESGRGIAQATAQFGVSSAEAVSFGAAVKSLGVQSELARSVFLRSFDAIRQAINKGGKDFQRLEKLTGLTGDALKREFDTNASGVFRKFLGGLNQLDRQGQDVTKTLREFGLSGVRINAVLPVLAKRVDVVNDALRQGSDAYDENTALQEEYERQADSLANTLQRLVNNFNDLATDIGQIVAPAVESLAEGLISIIGFLKDLNPVIKDIIVVGTAVTGVFLGIVAALASAKIAMIGLKLVAVELEVALLPLIAVPVAIIAIATAVIVLIKNFDKVVAVVRSTINEFAEFFGVIEKGESVFEDLREEVDETAKSMEELKLRSEEAGKGNGILGISAAALTLQLKDLNDEQKKLLELQQGKKDDIAFRNAEKLAVAAAVAARKQAELNKAIADEDKRRSDELLAFKKANIDALVNAQIAAGASEREIEIIKTQNLSTERQTRLDELTAKLGEEAAIRELARQEETERRKLDLEQQLVGARGNLELEAEIKKELTQLEKEESLKSVQIRKQAADRKVAIAKGQLGAEDKIRKTNLDHAEDTLGELTNLQRSSSKELFAVGKAAATAQAVINAYVSISEALKGPFPFNIVNAAVVGALAFEQVSRIQAQQAPSFQDGGIVPGNSFSGDNVSANVNSGEMILNREQQGRLFNMADGAGGGGGKEIVVNNTVELDGEVVFNSVSRQVADGRELGEVV